jgi:uncharacterized protein (DUF983 family)
MRGCGSNSVGADLQRTFDEMELALEMASEMCPHCGKVNLFPGFSRTMAYTCCECRRVVVTIACNTLEGLASLVSGLLAGSIALVGFGLDSLIEVISGTALLWCLHHDCGSRKLGSG